MPKYENKYGVIEVAKLLSSDRDTIKTIAWHFKDYLSKEANPEKGISRFFCLDDVLVLQYAVFFWSDDPDIEDIQIGLNREDHLEESYTNIISQIVPIFREVEDKDMGTEIPMLGAVDGWQSFHELADSYRIAGDYLVDKAYDKNETRELLYPILFNYRHSVELFLKSVVMDGEAIHELDKIYNKFKATIEDKFNEQTPKWLDDLIYVLNEFDHKSMTFRYGEEIPYIEFVAELGLFKEKMSWLAEAHYKIKSKLI